MINIKDEQRKLKRAGFDPTGVDGDWGPLSQAAMDAYQRRNGVAVPAWIPVAERELGIHEIPGVKNNKRVLEYHQHTSLRASEDEVPWCSSFANFCMDLAGLKGTNSAAAASWLTWGSKSQFLRYGCICVFRRTGGNHVAFGLIADEDSLMVLGGNQSDQVCVRVMPKANLIGYRWT